MSSTPECGAVIARELVGFCSHVCGHLRELVECGVDSDELVAVEDSTS